MHCADNKHASAHTIGYAGQKRISLGESLWLNLIQKDTLVCNAFLFPSAKSQKIVETVKNYTKKMKRHISSPYLSRLLRLKE